MAPKTTPATKEKRAKKLPVELTEEQRKRKDNKAYYKRIDAVEESRRRETSAFYYRLAEYSFYGVQAISYRIAEKYTAELAALEKKHKEEKESLQRTWGDQRTQLETQKKRITTVLSATKDEYIKDTTRAIQRLRKRSPPLTDEELSNNLPVLNRDLVVQQRLGLLPHTTTLEHLQHGSSPAVVDVEQTLRTAVAPILEFAQSIGVPADIPAPREHNKYPMFYHEWH